MEPVKSVHEHELVLLNEEEEQKNNDGNNKQVRCCKRCAKPISGPPYYYCYCQECDFFLHKSCGELPLEIAQHPLHPQHSLIFVGYKFKTRFKCDSCGQDCQSFGYRCCSGCDFSLDFPCALAAFLLPTTIAFGSHEHSLLTLLPKPALFCCDACGTTHDDKAGFSYKCTECPLWVHQDCASLPNTIRHNAHIHPLTLTCYFPRDYRNMFIYTTFCEFCKGYLKVERLVYRCEKCNFSAHVNCAKSETQQQSMDNDKCEREVENQVTIHATRLPVKDISVDLVSHLLKNKISLLQGENQNQKSTTAKDQINHFSHHHPLTLRRDHRDGQVKGTSNSSSSSSSSNNSEDPIRSRCQACTRPIVISEINPFYSCTKCSYFMHKSCSELPAQIMKHPFHPQHPLVLVVDKTPPHFLVNIFKCNACYNPCNGFAYHCTSCSNYYLDIMCSSLSDTIIHQAHEHPLLYRIKNDYSSCSVCKEPGGFLYEPLFGCVACGFNMHIRCALLPRTVRNGQRDEHPLTLSYCLSSNINQSEEYLCDTCELDVRPNTWFYYCAECDDPLHPGCITSLNYQSNIVFGNKTDNIGHPHPLTAVTRNKRTHADKPLCRSCGEPLISGFSLHCEECDVYFHFGCAQEMADDEDLRLYQEAQWREQRLRDH